MPSKRAIEKYVAELIKTYQKAQIKLSNIIINKKTNGNKYTFEQSLLRQINKEIISLNNVSQDKINAIAANSYIYGVNAVRDSLNAIGITAGGFAAFSKLHTSAIQLLTANKQEELITANNYIGRVMRDNIRQAGLDVTTEKFAIGQTAKQVKTSLVNRLVNEGVFGIITKSGRVIQLDSYGALVARSTSREATNLGTINQMRSLGYDLVKMSSHATSCPVCSSLQGRVYSINGENPQYPKLSIAYKGIYANIHPNCRHVLLPYIPRLADNPIADMAYSNRPFDVDQRSQAEIDRYNKDQQEKRKLNLDKRQWERYKLILPKDTPATLSAFRRSKYSNSENWQKLESEYRSIRQSEKV